MRVGILFTKTGRGYLFLWIGPKKTPLKKIWLKFFGKGGKRGPMERIWFTVSQNAQKNISLGGSKDRLFWNSLLNQNYIPKVINWPNIVPFFWTENPHNLELDGGESHQIVPVAFQGFDPTLIGRGILFWQFDLCQNRPKKKKTSIGLGILVLFFLVFLGPFLNPQKDFSLFRRVAPGIFHFFNPKKNLGLPGV